MAGNYTGTVDFSGKNLTEENVKECIHELRKMVLEDSNLQKFRTEDKYLLRFLYTTLFDVSLALKKMEIFSGFIIEQPEWFATVPPLDKRQQIEINDKVVLRELDKTGRPIFVIKLGKMDTINSCPAEQAQIFDFWLEYMMDDPKNQAAGLSTILDMKDFSWRLFKWFTPANIRLTLRKIDTYPFKELLLHVVNTNVLVSAVIKLIWPFMNDRLKDMFKFHFENWPSLHEHISPDLLPSEYGGTGPDIDYEKLNQLLFDRNDEIGVKLRYQLIEK